MNKDIGFVIEMAIMMVILICMYCFEKEYFYVKEYLYAKGYADGYQSRINYEQGK